MAYFKEYVYEIDAETGEVTRHWSAGREVPAHINSDVTISSSELIFCTGGSQSLVLLDLESFADYRIVDERPDLAEQARHGRAAAAQVLDAISRGSPVTNGRHYVNALRVTRGSLLDSVYACELSGRPDAALHRQPRPQQHHGLRLPGDDRAAAGADARPAGVRHVPVTLGGPPPRVPSQPPGQPHFDRIHREDMTWRNQAHRHGASCETWSPTARAPRRDGRRRSSRRRERLRAGNGEHPRPGADGGQRVRRVCARADPHDLEYAKALRGAARIPRAAGCRRRWTKLPSRAAADAQTVARAPSVARPAKKTTKTAARKRSASRKSASKKSASKRTVTKRTATKKSAARKLTS